MLSQDPRALVSGSVEVSCVALQSVGPVVLTTAEMQGVLQVAVLCKLRAWGHELSFGV